MYEIYHLLGGAILLHVYLLLVQPSVVPVEMIKNLLEFGWVGDIL